MAQPSQRCRQGQQGEELFGQHRRIAKLVPVLAHRGGGAHWRLVDPVNRGKCFAQLEQPERAAARPAVPTGTIDGGLDPALDSLLEPPAPDSAADSTPATRKPRHPTARR